METQEQQGSGRTGCESLGEGPASRAARGKRRVPTQSEHGGQGLPGLVRSLELPILGNKITLKEDCEFEVSFRSAWVSWPDTVKNGERKGECKRTGERGKEKEEQRLWGGMCKAKISDNCKQPEAREP